MKTKFKKSFQINRTTDDCGFGLVDAIVSMTLLFGVITYGIYFSSLRLSTVFNSNITRAINKEIQRDIERLKSDFWSMDFDESNGEYTWCQNETSLCRSSCTESAKKIVKYGSWHIEGNSKESPNQAWKPSAKRSKVFTGKPVLITRELNVQSPLEQKSLNKSIASINYRVQWGKKNIHWVSISLAPEAHGWCNQLI